MQTIIGLGKAGCEIADQFKPYPEYNILKIDVGLSNSESTYGFKPQVAPELYETNVPAPLEILQTASAQVLFITSCGSISASSLQLLKQIKETSQITVIYVMPDLVGLPELSKSHNKVLFNVFQEYARSAVFKKIILVDNKQISHLMGNTPVLQYWNKINQAIASTYHMINVFDHSRAVFSTFSRRLEVARIATIGLVSWQKEEENLFFKLDIPREKRYYYAIPQKMLEEDTTLMTKIQNQVKNGVEHDKMKVSYGIYSTQYSEPYVYCESNSSMIQKIPAL
jgi:L-rhamnose mutarotase